MNRELLDPFALDYPESVSRTLVCGHTTCLRFDPLGTHIAAGLGDGSIAIWDFGTFGITRILKGHTRAIQSVW